MFDAWPAGVDATMAELPPGVSVVGLAQFRGELFMATSNGVYIYRDGKFHQLEIVNLPTVGKDATLTISAN